MTLAALLLAAGVFLVVWRQHRIHTLTALSMRRRRLSAAGVVIGGEGFELARFGAPAVLLIHGAGDTPQTVHYLADELFARGYHVSAPLLPGHGRTIEDFRHVTAGAWSDAASAALSELQSRHEWVGVIGVSMGGALAVQLAAASPELPALGLVAPYLSMPHRIARAAQWSWLWGLLSPLVASSEGRSILDPAEQERNLAYGVFTAAALRALRETMRRAVAALPRVTVPTLLIQSREDNRIAVADTEREFARLGATEKRLEWISGAAHIITVDFGHERVNAALADWMDAHRGAHPLNPTNR